MKRILLAALVVALSFPASAQLRVIADSAGHGPPISGTLTTITTDAVTIDLPGYQWATAQFTVTSAGTATVTAQYSIDNRVNWLTAPYAKKLSAVSANPTVQAISASTLTTADVWEVPLPANATNFRLLCGGTGTTTAVALQGGLPYVPGVLVMATLYDVTSAVNTALDTGILDTAGWTGLSASVSTPAGGGATIKNVDDAGANPVINVISIPAAAGIVLNLSASGSTASTTGTSGTSSVSWRWKRTQATSTGVGGLTSRIRIESWR